jgi:nitric oxide synthase-interacting protein
MSRKSKQPGGCGPLTRYEMTHYAQVSGYGTVTSRLGTVKFGDCCLSQHAAVDPVATPSGHIYSREAIVSYLLTKTKQLKEEQILYEDKKRKLQWEQEQKQIQDQHQHVTLFRNTQESVLQIDSTIHAAELKHNMGKQLAGGTHTSDAKQDVQIQVKQSSFWVAEAQPTVQHATSLSDEPPPPPQRPPSPMSGQPLKLKDLISLQIQREGEEAEDKRVVCAVSGKVITTQPVVTIKSSGLILLKQVYETVVHPTMICPITGIKIKPEDVLELQCGKSGFAASGSVTAKRYRPTLT